MASLEVLNVERLKTYDKAAKETFARLGKLLGAKQQELLEYDSIVLKLEELPRKRTQCIMCPVGSVGFLPANIVHTNEVLVGLGDGYFLDTTCYDAVQILKRRRKVVEKGIADLHEHRRLLENYSTYAKRLFEHQGSSDEVEIREEYDEQKEDELRRRRKSRKMAPRLVTKTLAEINAEAEIMKRLEELEQQELRNGELDSSFDIDASAGNEEAPPSLDKILEKLDDDDTKCLMSILASEKSVIAAVPEGQSSNDAEPTTSAETTNVEPVTSPEPSLQKEEEAGIRVAEIVELPIKKIKPSVLTTTDSANVPSTTETSVPPKAELSTGYFRGDDLLRMLAEQEQEYEENSQSYQPPPGISTQSYQRLLRTVDEMEDDEESDDGDEEGENGRVFKEINGVRSSSAPSTNISHGSDLDSDDLAEPEPDGPVDFGPFTAVNLGTDARPVEEHLNETDGVTSVAPKASTSALAEGEVKKASKKKKSVVFAENLEKAMMIDKNAPPSNARAEPSTSSGASASILRNASEQTPVNRALLSDSSETQRVILPESKVAFTGVVQERNVEVLDDAVPAVGGGDSSKPKSLFRMKRLKNHA
ncbi:unnamed protein product [Cylicocyclus nassatus]|uniref:Uncharacterized protein n=1 Tax=Cylicocyclus nassatus TaxID=53992 RepID=A0AA36DVQ2_CYLNA|nr:unnamed protein product [Cylicocyclus nassatus]